MVVRLIKRKLLEHKYRGEFDWRGIPKAVLPETSNSSKRVLVATSTGGYEIGAKLDSTLVHALTIRGAKVDVLLCDGILPGCQLCKTPSLSPEEFVRNGPSRRCDSCVAMGRAMFGASRESVVSYSDLLAKSELAAITAGDSSNAEQMASAYISVAQIDEHTRAGALRFYARGDFDGEAHAGPVVERYRRACVMTALVIGRLLEREKYDCVVAHHGIYAPQGVVNEVCKTLGVEFVSWNPGYRAGTFIFSHGDTYHRTMISEAENEWANYVWTAERRTEIVDYLNSRRLGDRDWIHFNRSPVASRSALYSELGLRDDRPVVALLSNVLWDAQLHYSSNAFRSMLDWVGSTIDYFSKRTDLQLVIRVHPAEVTGAVPSRQKLVDEVKRLYPVLPLNVFMIPPESPLSTYTLGDVANAAIIYNTKMGIELAAAGKHVIVAGEAWIRGKGFCHDASSEEEYLRLLAKLPFSGPLPEDLQERAQIYAYHFFFRRSIELPMFRMSDDRLHLQCTISTMDELLPGRAPGLDAICDGILTGTQFVPIG